MKDLRIIAGKHKSRKIKHPEVASVRPTKDRIREAVFSMIQGTFQDAEVLDLYAGSGAYGLEAISRGAKRAVFIEKNLHCSEIIEENSASLGEEERTEVVTAEVEHSGAFFERSKGRFSLIFSDPPYNMFISKNTLIMVNQYDILVPSGLLVIETSSEEPLPEAEGNLCLVKAKTYNDISISIYKRK